MDDFKVKMRNKINCAKNRFAGPIKVVKTFFVEFCDNSNIHGVRYFTERQLHWSERLWWLVAIVVSLWMCGSLTRNIWDGWNREPVTFSFIEKELPVAVIPFPQVTICPERPILQSITDALEGFGSVSNLPDIDKDELNLLVHICPRIHNQLKMEDNFTNESIYLQIETDTLIYGFDPLCQFFMNSSSYCRLGITYTEDGYCITFNALNPSSFYTNEMITMQQYWNRSRIPATNWHFETPFNYSLDEKRYPYTTPLYGRDSSISFKLSVEEMLQHCNGVNQGYKLALNMPGESVRISENFIRILPSEEIRIIIKPKLTFTAEELRSYDPNQRQCYFNSERKLRFFKIYSQSSCEIECLANFTQIECGCVKFNMPRDSSTRICGGGKIDCYKSADHKFIRESIRDECKCLPSCTTVEYQAQIQRSNLHPDMFMLLMSTIEDRNLNKTGLVYTYYSDNYVTTVKRIPVYTYVDFLANCGGFLGVCLGASALSLVELIYFTSLRLYWANHTPESSEIFSTIEQKLSNFRLVRGIRWFFNELCDNSNIHGFFYFTRRKLHWSERIFWILSVGASIWMSYSLINGFWLQWEENPVKLSYSNTPAAISTIPLPTITICSNIKFLLNRLDTKSDEMTDIEGEAFTHTDSLHRSQIAEKFSKIEGDTSTAIYDVIQRIAPQLNETMSHCWWRKNPVNCTKYFVPVLTEEGLCFSFNELNSNDIYTDEMGSEMKIVLNNMKVNNWNFQNGYTNESSENDYPMRLLDSAEEATLQTTLSIDFDAINYEYKYFGTDFKVFFRTPGDSVQYLKKFYQVSLLKDVRISIHPKKTTTSAELQKYTPNQRQCYIESERSLRFFKIYTQANCEQECLANHLLELFGCVKFSSPRHQNTPICGVSKKTNITFVEDFFWSDDRVLEANGQDSAREKCNCLQTCTIIEYIAEVDQSNLQEYHMNPGKGNSSQIHVAELTISFGNSVEIVERIETYTFVDFLAICGGLLGLFMGISALSIIELIYFCTLRWFWKLRRERADNAVEVLETRTINVMPAEDSNC